MKAIVCTQYGPPELLEFREVQKPVPKDTEVLAKVRSTRRASGPRFEGSRRTPPRGRRWSLLRPFEGRRSAFCGFTRSERPTPCNSLQRSPPRTATPPRSRSPPATPACLPPPTSRASRSPEPLRPAGCRAAQAALPRITAAWRAMNVHINLTLPKIWWSRQDMVGS